MTIFCSFLLSFLSVQSSTSVLTAREKNLSSAPFPGPTRPAGSLARRRSMGHLRISARDSHAFWALFFSDTTKTHPGEDICLFRDLKRHVECYYHDCSWLANQRAIMSAIHHGLRDVFDRRRRPEWHGLSWQTRRYSSKRTNMVWSGK
jgi:hypothetical protein